MHKLLHRVHSNPKDSTSDKKKKGAKSNVKNALKSTIAAPLALSHSEVKSDIPNEKIPSAASSDQNAKTNEDFYSMASDEVVPTSQEDEIEEDVYENTDLILANSRNCTKKHNSMPRQVTLAPLSNDNQSSTPEGLYDMADSFAGEITPVKTESVEDQSDTDPDDIYSHLATEPSTNDQLYDRLERNLSDTSDTVYNCLGDHELSNLNQDTGPNFRASVYEDVNMPINQTNIATNQALKPRTKSHLSPGDDDDTYEKVSFPSPVKAPVPSTNDENDGTDKELDDDTYEDVSNLPIQRFREPQPLPPRRNLKVGTKPSSINVESISPNVPPPRQTLATPDDLPQKHDTELKPANVTNEAKHSIKHSKSKHPSQWFSKPFLKTKPKLELRKRANSKQNTLSFDENVVPVSPTEPRPTDANIRSRARLPTPQRQGRLTSPTRTPLAGSLEESPLYKTMQEKLRIPEDE